MTDYVLGHKPGWDLVVDGSTIWSNGVPVHQQPVDDWQEGEAAINRLDVELGMDMVHTCTFNLVGSDAAEIAKRLFPRGSEITVRMGYRDTTFGPMQMFRGVIMQGFPGAIYPVTIELAADSPAYKIRETWIEDTEGEENMADGFIAYINKNTGLEANFIEYNDVTAEEGASFEGNALDSLGKWIETHNLHYVDAMDGKILFFYPHNIEQVYVLDANSDKRRWELPVRAQEGEEEYAAILRSWAPEINYVDAPAKVNAAWGYYEDGSDELMTELVEAEIENGIEDTAISLGIIRVATKEKAQAVVDAWAEERQWLSVQGTFELATGIPIRPFDTIVARNGPDGLEEYFDKEMVVTHVHHIFDDRGWITKGRMRGLIRP